MEAKIEEKRETVVNITLTEEEARRIATGIEGIKAEGVRGYVSTFELGKKLKALVGINE